MRVEVDLGICRSYAVCTGLAPDVFELDDDGLVRVLQPDVPGDRIREMEDIALMCPSQAISLVDE